jgi:diaminopimelate epimerase
VIKQEVDFVKLSPTQNMTVLVTTEHPIEEYRAIASKLMSYGNVHAEQVGFVQKPESPEADARLHMAADEFCGNACMALAALLASEGEPAGVDSTDVVLETSGVEGFVTCQVRKRRHEYHCQLTMPIPRKVEQAAPVDAGGDSALVVYQDSLHVVIETDRVDGAVRERAQSLATRLGETWEVPLIGIMLYDPGRRELAPLVHVPSLNSMVWERGCGSGTASVGAYLAWKENGAVAVSVAQPGGTMYVAVSYDQGEMTDIKVSGSVKIVAEGKAYIDV